MASPLVTPLRIWPNSGLTFAWEDTSTETGGTGDMHLSSSGVTCAMTIRIHWYDLPTAVQQILGYSYRDATVLTTAHQTPFLRRVLPWQHPYFGQLVAKSIASVRGEINRGNSSLIDNSGAPVDLFEFGVVHSGFGQGYGVNSGPWSMFEFALLTVQFWRPPYFLRTDKDILATTGPLVGDPQEWLRYLDKKWTISSQMLSRENGQFVYAPGQSNSGQPFQGSVGQAISHMKVVRTWYEIPEAGIFTPLPDGTPNGIPAALIYMKTPTTNPVTGYVQAATAASAGTGYLAFPTTGCVNSPIGGGISEDFAGTDVKFLGCFTGTLRLDAIELVPRELQLPAYLMAIPIFANNEAISQQQYDVRFHFDLFDPVRPPALITNTSVMSSATVVVGSGTAASTIVYNGTTVVRFNSGQINEVYRGHNLVPYQDGLWYMPISQLVPIGATTSTTAFQYCDFADMFFII